MANTPKYHLGPVPGGIAVIGLGQAGQEVQLAFYKLYQRILGLKTVDDIDEEAMKRAGKCIHWIRISLLSNIQEKHSNLSTLLGELIGRKKEAEQEKRRGEPVAGYVICSPIASRTGLRPIVRMARADTDPVTLDEIFQAYLDEGLAYVESMDLSPPADLPPTSRVYEIVSKYELPLGGGGMRQRPRVAYELLKTVEQEGLHNLMEWLCLAGCRNPEQPCDKLMSEARVLAHAAQEKLGIDQNLEILTRFYAQFPACLKSSIIPEVLWDLGSADRVFLLHSLSGTGAGLALWLLDEHRLPEGCSCRIMYERGGGKVRDIVDVAVAPAVYEVEYFPHLSESVKWSLERLTRYLERGLKGSRLTLFLVDLDVAVGHALLNMLAERLSSDEFFSSRELRDVNRLLSYVVNTGSNIGMRLRGLHDYAVSRGVSHRDADVYIAGSLYPLIAVEWRRVEIWGGGKKIDYSEAVGHFLHGLILPSYVPGPVAVKYVEKAAESREDAETAVALMVAHGLLAPFSRRVDVGVETVALFFSRGLIDHIREKARRLIDCKKTAEILRELFNNGLEVKLFTVDPVKGQPEEFNQALWAYVMVSRPIEYGKFLLSKYPRIE